jgi:oxygen-independent coproporphyrinogen-3 oxidase
MATETNRQDDAGKTEVGSYFVSNYPPYSQWNEDSLPAIRQALDSPPRDVPLGLYLHIPFCRKRCNFCYFRVYTDRNASDVERYVAGLSREIELVSRLPVMGERPFRFVYFGGGTPSFLSSRQLTSLVDRLRANINWDDAEEVTFECEPGTLSQSKLQTLKQLGVTRISLGVESLDDDVLKNNGRAHVTTEAYRAWDWIRDVGFPNANIDLIAGMVGETDETWRRAVAKTIELGPDSVTIYQMELPYNTIYSQEILGNRAEVAVADWPTKRAWVDFAFNEFAKVGYAVSSAYTVVRDPAKVNFSYRDNLWRGSDLLSTGVASFGHVSGVHYQNQSEWSSYLDPLERDELPLARALAPTPHQLLIREMILQIKTGVLDVAYFREKFGVDVLSEWRDVWQGYVERQTMSIDGDVVTVSRAGLLRIDALIAAFFEAEHRDVRYT